MKRGFLVLEILLASLMFGMFATAGVVGLLSAYNMSRSAEERTIAVNFAQEGLEAIRSIKNQGFADATNSAATGVQRDGAAGNWRYNGTTNNVFGKYTRTIKIEDVNRDASGNIVTAPSGTLDYNTKKVTADVTWNFKSSQSLATSLSQYLTNWETPIGGILIYGDTTTVPKVRDYSQPTDVFSIESLAATSAAGRSFDIKTSPIKHEAIAGYVTAAGVLQIMCYDGTDWYNEWSVTVGGTGNTKRFSISYESTSGDAMVTYSRNAAAVNAINFRTKLGTSRCGTANWAAALTLPTTTTLTSGIVYWIRTERSPVAASNNIAIAWSDAASDLGAAVWNGSAWGNLPATPLETNLEYAVAAGDVMSFDLAIESLSGDVMVVWGVLTTTTACTAGTNCMRYRAFSGGVWGAITAIPTVADSGTSIDLSAAPNSDALLLAAMDNGSVAANLDDLSTAYWSGLAWTGRANVDNSCGHPVAGSKLVSSGFLVNGATTRGVVQYQDSGGTGISYKVCNGSAACTSPADFAPGTAFAYPKVWNDFQFDPKNPSSLMFTLSDNNSDLWAKELTMSAAAAFTWTNSDANAALETTLGQAITKPFSFAYWYK